MHRSTHWVSVGVEVSSASPSASLPAVTQASVKLQSVYEFAIVEVEGGLTEGHDVGGGDAQDRQFGETLPLRERRDRAAEVLEGRADGVHPRPLPGVGLLPPLVAHALVVATQPAASLVAPVSITTVVVI